MGSTFVVKIYRGLQGGKFTQYLEKNVKVGDEIMCSGPIGCLRYCGAGKIVKRRQEMKPKKRLVLLAGGTGVTPLYSIALASSLANDGVEIWFLFSNKTKDDILIKKELDKLAETNPNFHLTYTLTRHDDDKHGEWTGKTGRVSLDM